MCKALVLSVFDDENLVSKAVKIVSVDAANPKVNEKVGDEKFTVNTLERRTED